MDCLRSSLSRLGWNLAVSSDETGQEQGRPGRTRKRPLSDPLTPSAKKIPEAEAITPLSDLSLSERNPVVSPVEPMLTDLPPAPPVCNPAFLAESQALVHRFMHRPLPGQLLEPGRIARLDHGAMHLCRAAMWIPVLLTLRRQLGDSDALKLSREELSAVMKAAMLHDSGREGEEADTPEWERASGEHCEDHLLAIGCPAQLAVACREGIINKDRQDRSRKTLIEKLIHDADCLEVMRVRGSFDMAELDLYQDYLGKDKDIDKLVYKLSSEVREVLGAQGDLMVDVKLVNQMQQWKEPPEQCPAKQVKDSDSYSKKKQFEFAHNAMANQLANLKEGWPWLYGLYLQSAGEPAPVSELNPLEWEKKQGALGCSAGSHFNGLYQDPKTQKQYYVKEPDNPDSARNEVLMANLAKVLGLKVPEVELVRRDNRSFVVSSWLEGLCDGSQSKLQQLSRQQRAQLFVVAAVLGNADIVGSCFDNILVDDKGNPVAVDWGEAGEYGAPLASKHKTGSFSSTVFELETLRNLQHPWVAKTLDPSVRIAASNAAKLFMDLTEEDIAGAASGLINPEIKPYHLEDMAKYPYTAAQMQCLLLGSWKSKTMLSLVKRVFNHMRST